MPEDANLTKAQKLAAARKKLKEYQQRSHDAQNKTTATNAAVATMAADDISSTASNLSERSESEVNLNGYNAPHAHSRTPSGEATLTADALITTTPGVTNAFTPQIDYSINNVQSAASYFAKSAATVVDEQQATVTEIDSTLAPTARSFEDFQATLAANLNTIQVLISEKAQLSAELNKLRTTCREQELNLEELRHEQASGKNQQEQFQQKFMEQQRSTEQLRKTNAELQHKLAQNNAKTEDQQTHLAELKHQLNLQQTRINALEKQHTEKCNELEMSQLRVQQLSDESNFSNDNRVETLTQTKYMHEQQIRDLQAMVAQLTQDKEQANIQYQTYVQHLNSEITKLNERNGELSEKHVSLQERERQLVEHVSGLEREIQKNINLQAQFKQTQKESNISAATDDLANELSQLKERCNDFDFERHEFQLKIKSQEDKLAALQQDLQTKEDALTTLKEQLERVHDEQPDNHKLLATMESDKVAASRALTQNVELKKQLDELELRFVQLTNDKAELMNKLDAEEFANREMRTNFATMEQKLQTIDERFKFKDDEMIRLSHENMELKRDNLVMQQQVDRLKHYEVKDYHRNYVDKETNESSAVPENACAAHEHVDSKHQTHHHHDHQHHHHHHDENGHEHMAHSDKAIEATEEDVEILSVASQEHINAELCEHEHEHQQRNPTRLQKHITNIPVSASQQLDTAEAVEKLQSRFTQLISKVADLTEEKQGLEHLVLQLQCETETIGEYIALYQTQRRMLKQREYEKAAQMKLLEAERAQLREKITILNNLVRSLGNQGVELPINHELQTALTQVQEIDVDATEQTATESSSESIVYNDSVPTNASNLQKPQQQQITIPAQKLPLESQQILHKIQDIITEIKENTEQDVPTVQHTVDHLNCCLGKVEVV